jgi:hypothetical protein
MADIGNATEATIDALRNGTTAPCWARFPNATPDQPTLPRSCSGS